MPTYDYKCPNCGVVAQFSHKMNEPFVKICGPCMLLGKNALMVKGFGGGTAIHFKGTGFYETDYKGKS